MGNLLWIILLIVFVLAIFTAPPVAPVVYPAAATWGWGPSGGLWIVLIVLAAIVLLR